MFSDIHVSTTLLVYGINNFNTYTDVYHKANTIYKQKTGTQFIIIKINTLRLFSQ